MTAVMTNGHATIDAGRPVSVFDDRSVFSKYRVHVTFADGAGYPTRVMGGVPQNPDIIEGWLRTRLMGGDAELKLQVVRTLEELGVDVPEMASADEMIEAAKIVAKERNGNTFWRRDGELCLADYQVKACLKECANILYAGDRWGATRKGPKSAVAEWVFVDETRIPLGRMEPDGVHTQAGSVSGPQGKRQILTYYDYVEGANVAFTFSVTDDRLTMDQWARVLVQGQKIGLGAVRSLSYGQFLVTEFERV